MNTTPRHARRVGFLLLMLILICVLVLSGSISGATEIVAAPDAIDSLVPQAASAPLTYTVTFDANGGKFANGNTTSSGSRAAGGPVGAFSAIPIRFGYTFLGWSTTPTGGTAFSAHTIMNSDLTYYAQWTDVAVQYTVTFDANGGVFSTGKTTSSGTRAPGSPVGVFNAIPTRPGYVFKGWFTALTGGAAFNPNTIMDSFKTYYAQWNQIFKVTFDANGGKFANGKTSSSGSRVAGKPVGAFNGKPFKAGSAFAGWFTAPSGGSKFNPNTIMNGNKTYYAQYKKLPKIYLAPSDQLGNLYTGYSTNESVECYKIAQYCRQALEKNGYTVKLPPAHTPFMTMIADSNALGAGVYLAFHTNAGGSKGAEVITNSKLLSNIYVTSVYKQIAAINPNGGRGIFPRDDLKQPTLTNGVCVLVEAEFHDNAAGAKWILNNHKRIAEAIAKGICVANGVPYTPL